GRDCRGHPARRGAGCPFAVGGSRIAAVFTVFSRRGIALERPDALSARVVGDGDGRLADVVVVIRFGQLVTEAVRVFEGAGLPLLSRERRVDGDAYDV